MNCRIKHGCEEALGIGIDSKQNDKESILVSPFPREISFSVKFVDEENQHIIPREELAILTAKVVKSRKDHFVAGRAAAHTALEVLLGSSDFPLLRGEKGEPLWPPGIVGAITHTKGIAASAVAQKCNCDGIGLDLELMDRRVSIGIADRVCTPKEQEWVKESVPNLKMLFSAKEAVFKAFYPIEGVYLDFADVELTWDKRDSRFSGVLIERAGKHYPIGYGFDVGCILVGPYVFAFMNLPPLARSLQKG
ncbi:MAG: 4'-phosphopantetheinyl transferase superfamily protein [Pseudomonadota bacterium]